MEREKKVITIKDIAEKANVSRTTVSRVLNDSGYVNETTKKRVLAVIEETGYVPSEQAKALRTKQTKVIGVILPKISTETASWIVEGIDEALVKQGYQILLINTQLMWEKEMEAITLLKSKNVDGIILSATNTNDELLEELRNLKIPFVSVGQQMPDTCSVIFNDYMATKDIVNTLIDKGHQKIAFLGVSEDDPAVGYWRRKAYEDAMAEHHITVDEQWMQTGFFAVQSGFEGMKNIDLNCKEKPTAVIAVTDRIAIGAINYLKESGRQIPEDVAVFGMGASEMSQYITPSLSTVDFNYKQAGSVAAEQILKSISGKNKQPENYMIPYRLLCRNSI